MVAMSLSRLALLVLAVVPAACGSSVETVETTSSGAGGAHPTSATSGASTATSGGGHGQTGAGGCQPWEECTCAPCDEQGGTCLLRCNFGAGYECFTPGPPAEDEFSCGGFVNCDGTQACIDVDQAAGDTCIDHFCAVLPDVCAYDRTCACLAPFIDDPIFAQGPGACTDVGGEIHVTYAGGAARPPWDAPWCGPESCAGEEVCWACSTDGDGTVDSYVCSATDPGPDGSPSCTRQWGEAE